MRLPSLLLIFLLSSLHAFSQDKLDYLPADFDSLKQYIASVTEKKRQAFNGEHQKEIAKILEERKEKFIKKISDSSFIFDERINTYLDGVLREIYRANPDLDTKDYYFFIDKSPVPNAACYGNGIFTVNLGLIELMDTDDQIAFVLCHEIAHMTLKHNDASLMQYVSTINGKDTRKKINKAKNTRYGRRQAVSEVVRDLSYNFQKRSRKSEIEADSVGFALFNKTRYDKAAAVQALGKLNLSDTLLFTTDTKIRRHFNFEAYPFKEVWVEEEQTLFDLTEAADDLAFDKDSLTTHPDIPLRIEKLGVPAGNETPVTSAPLQNLKQVVAKNNITVSLDALRLDMALYQVLALREKGAIPTDTYCITVAGLLKKTYELKESHQFGKHVGPVSPFSEEKYLNEVRLFLHNVQMKNIRKIGHNFCEQHKAEMQGNSEFSEIAAYFNRLNQ